MSNDYQVEIERQCSLNELASSKIWISLELQQQIEQEIVVDLCRKNKDFHFRKTSPSISLPVLDWIVGVIRLFLFRSASSLALDDRARAPGDCCFSNNIEIKKK